MKPSRLLRFEHFGAFNEQARCTGRQVAAIIQLVQDQRPDIVWYAADVQVIGPPLVARRQPEPVRLGDSATTLRAVEAVDQFESGVLAGVPAEIPDPHFRAGGLWTEDDDASDLGDSIVEIRAFDTTCLIIATADNAIANRISTGSARD